MIYENPYWIVIYPKNNPELTRTITGKWLYFDHHKENIFSLIDELDQLVETGVFREVKISRKNPETDPFPEKPCVLCVFTSDDPDEKERVKNILKDNFNFSVDLWKSDKQTSEDWEKTGWLSIQSNINKIRKEISSGKVPDTNEAIQKLLVLSKQLERSLMRIQNLDQLKEVQRNLLYEQTHKIITEANKPNPNLEQLVPSLELLDKDLKDFGREKIPIVIIFLASDPTDAARLRLGKEFREINEQLTLAELRKQFDLTLPQLSVRPKDITRALLNEKPQIVHFSGHGTSEGALYFEDDNGHTLIVEPEALAALFEQFENQVECVVLNACYAEAQAKAISKYINYVIGMNDEIGDEATIAFSIGFYQALGAGKNIEEAFKLGCVQIRLQGIPEYLTPVLKKKGQA
jgi:hypothetical protein